MPEVGGAARHDPNKRARLDQFGTLEDNVEPLGTGRQEVIDATKAAG